MGYLLLSIIRNLNTVRAINQELGEPVDRFVLMARWLVSFIAFISYLFCQTQSLEIALGAIKKGTMKCTQVNLLIIFLTCHVLYSRWRHEKFFFWAILLGFAV